MCFKIISYVTCVYQVFDYMRKPNLLSIKRTKSFVFFFLNNCSFLCLSLKFFNCYFG